jgi:fatty-acyl-CoA synthase
VSYASGPSSEPLVGETIGGNLDRVAAAHPGVECLVSRHQGLRYTYAEFVAAVDECARAFLALGVEQGDRVGIWSPNRAEWALVQYATAKVGAILVNVNPAYRTSEVEYALGQSGTSVLVAASTFKTSNYAAMIAEVRPKLPALQTVILLDGASGQGDLTWDAFVGRASEASADQLAERQASLQFDDPINIQYTSGTTGFPKGATLSHHNILNNGYNVTAIQGLGVGDRLCVPVPLYHCFGMVMGNLGCTTQGATIVYPAEAFEPGAVLEAVAEERCVSLYGVPTMFIGVLDHPEFASYDLTSLRTGVMAGSPCPIEVMKRCVSDMHMAEVTICYGMTETSPVSFQSRTDDPIERRVSTVGRVHPHVECKVVDPATGAAVPPGTQGEVCTRLPRHARLLGQRRGDPRRHRRGWMDAHRRLGRDGRRGLPRHLRAHQGHDHQRRREHLPARDRRVPPHPPCHRRRPGDRRARREVRRGDLRLGALAGGSPPRAQRTRGLLPGQDRPLQGAALPRDRRRVPHDRHRQDPQGRDARGLDKAPGARRRLAATELRRAAAA